MEIAMAENVPNNEKISYVFTHGPGVFAQLESGRVYRVCDGEFIDCITPPSKFPAEWK